MNILGQTRACAIAKALTVLEHNLNTEIAETHSGSEHNIDSKGKKCILQLYYAATLPLLFYSMKKDSVPYTPPSFILNCQGFTVTGNLESG